MEEFLQELGQKENVEEEIMEEVLELLLSASDFETFKGLMLDAKAGAASSSSSGDAAKKTDGSKPAEAAKDKKDTSGDKKKEKDDDTCSFAPLAAGGIAIGGKKLAIHANEESDGDSCPDLDGALMGVSLKKK